MTSGRWLGSLLLRFALAYGLLLAIAVPTSLFERLERPLVAVANALLSSQSEHTALGISVDEPERYVLHLERRGETRQVERALHAHAYLLLLLVAGVLATPGLSLRQRGGGLLVGSLLIFALGIGLLLSDVAAWERAAFPELPPTGGPAAWVARGFDALHRSNGVGLLPLLLWLLYAAWRSNHRETRPAGSRRESV